MFRFLIALWVATSKLETTTHLVSGINFISKISKQDHIIFDPQTSGGLLVSVNKIKANQVLEKLKKSNHHASIIGEVIEKHEIILN